MTQIEKNDLCNYHEIQGYYELQQDGQVIIHWTCPDTGLPKKETGYFEDDGDAYYHDVNDQHGEYSYTVIADTEAN